MIKKLILLVGCGIFSILMNAQHIPDLSLSYDYASEVKSLDEFRARFNGEESKPGIYNDKNSRRANLLNLFDLNMDKGGLTKEQFINKLNNFMDSVLINDCKFEISNSNLWSESYNWMSYCFALEDLLKVDWDIWSVHPYGLKGPEDYIDAYAHSRGLMVQADNGPTDRPWINSERGFSIGEGEGWVDGEENLAYEYQAWTLVRQYLIDLLEGMPITIWYEWSGSEGFAMYSTRDNHPALMACKVLVQQLKGYSLDQRIDVENEQDFVLRFKNAGENTKLVAWAAPPKNQSQDNITPHTITLDVNTTKEAVTLTGIYGETSQLIVDNGKINVALAGAPVYIDLEDGTAISGIQSSKGTNIQIFSTTNDRLIIESEQSLVGKIVICDLFGNTIYQHTGNCNNFAIDMADFIDGMHIVNIYDQNNKIIKTQKIIK